MTDADLAPAFDYARFAPQGGNRQPVRWVVVRDGAKKQQLQEWYLQPWKAYLSAAEAGDVGIGAEKAAHVAVGRRPEPFPTKLDRIPVSDMVFGDKWGSAVY